MTPRAFQTLMRRRTFSILEASSSSLMFFTSSTCQLSLENSAFWRMLQALITSSRIVISFFKQRSISAAWPTATSTIVSYSDFQMKTSFLQKLTSAASIKISSSIWSKADLKLQGSLLFRDQLEEVIPKPAPLCQLEVTPPTIEAPARTITEGWGSERNQKRFLLVSQLLLAPKILEQFSLMILSACLLKLLVPEFLLGFKPLPASK